MDRTRRPAPRHARIPESPEQVPAGSDSRPSPRHRAHEAAEPTSAIESAPQARAPEPTGDAEVAEPTEGTQEAAAPEESSLTKAALLYKRFGKVATARNALALLAALVVAWTWVTGGMDSVLAKAADRTPVVDAGQSVTATPFKVEVTQMFWSDDAAPLEDSSLRDTLYLVAKARIDTTAHMPLPTVQLSDSMTVRILGQDLAPQSPFFSNIATKDGSFGGPTVYRAVDHGAVKNFQPAMPQDYWLVWSLPVSTPRATELRIEYHALTYRESSLDGSWIWADRRPVALQDVQVAADGRVE
ncbi:hypothetical protein I6B53_01315 [Schaalia sp. 19OD2882]|uniref:hypothetical protein n=1 Tax=Schaalia sp. 19OD2882 TaxID=2794089 RepID=UPI001C1EBF20|nr:hypothetical protein [Schaalia sp. 19OD2882]QWW19802.1 hypothetical protein I6B53_01315 [Schaalia sp. 19OD2882]